MRGIPTATRRKRSAFWFCGLLSLAGCTSNVPLEISPQFNPPRWPNWAQDAAPLGSHACNLALAPIVDERLNPQSFGTVNNQTVRSGDPTGWVRKAFEALARDRRIVIKDGEPGNS